MIDRPDRARRCHHRVRSIAGRHTESDRTRRRPPRRRARTSPRPAASAPPSIFGTPTPGRCEIVQRPTDRHRRQRASPSVPMDKKIAFGNSDGTGGVWSESTATSNSWHSRARPRSSARSRSVPTATRSPPPPMTGRPGSIGRPGPGSRRRPRCCATAAMRSGGSSTRWWRSPARATTWSSRSGRSRPVVRSRDRVVGVGQAVPRRRAEPGRKARGAVGRGRRPDHGESDRHRNRTADLHAARDVGSRCDLQRRQPLAGGQRHAGELARRDPLQRPHDRGPRMVRELWRRGRRCDQRRRSPGGRLHVHGPGVHRATPTPPHPFAAFSRARTTVERRLQPGRQPAGARVLGQHGHGARRGDQQAGPAAGRAHARRQRRGLQPERSLHRHHQHRRHRCAFGTRPPVSCCRSITTTPRTGKPTFSPDSQMVAEANSDLQSACGVCAPTADDPAALLAASRTSLISPLTPLEQALERQFSNPPSTLER